MAAINSTAAAVIVSEGGAASLASTVEATSSNNDIAILKRRFKESNFPSFKMVGQQIPGKMWLRSCQRTVLKFLLQA
jgi:hypothetical protein